MTLKKPILKILAAALILVMLAGLIAVAAGADTASDPLVTLSYLTGTYKKNLLSEVNTAIAAGQKSLSADMSAQITGLQGSLAAENPAAAVTTFKTVTLASGKSVSVAAGAQVLFLSGSAKAESVGLSDSTDGSSPAAGAALTVNHLYFAGGGNRITATGETKMLVSS